MVALHGRVLSGHPGYASMESTGPPWLPRSTRQKPGPRGPHREQPYPRKPQSPGNLSITGAFSWIDAARQMLEQTDQDLLTIALAVGFSDASYFTKVFRHQTDMTPSAWRARGG